MTGASVRLPWNKNVAEIPVMRPKKAYASGDSSVKPMTAPNKIAVTERIKMMAAVILAIGFFIINESLGGSIKVLI